MSKLSGYIATCLWLTAVMCMVAGTIERNIYGVGWGLFLGMMGLGFTTWVMSERRDSQRVDHVVELVDALHSAGPRRLP